MLRVEKVSAGYGAAQVLDGIDIEVPPRGIVALIGPNGAGKSTLAKVISGLLSPSAGRILFDGTPIQHAPPRARLALGLAHVPEGRQIFAGLSVADNLRLGAFACRRAIGERGILARMDEVCGFFPVLRERGADIAGNLSGGQQQMLAIARALMSRPRLLLLDEPSLGLSPRLVAEIFRLIAAFRDGGVSILLSEQNARLSLAIADHGYVIEAGRVALSGPARDLLHRAEVAERYLGIANSDGGTRTASRDADRARLAQRLSEIIC